MISCQFNFMCDAEDCFGIFTSTPLDVGDLAEAAQEAQDEGWHVCSKTGKCLCPKHNEKVDCPPKDDCPRSRPKNSLLTTSQT